MKYYVPSRRRSPSFSFRRRRSKKPFLLAGLVLTLVLSFFLVGFDTKPFKGEKTASQVQDDPSASIKKLSDHAGNPSIDAQAKDQKSPGITEPLYNSKAEQTTAESDNTMAPEALIEEKIVTVSSGDTLMGLLVREGLERAEAHSVITTLQEVFNPRRIRQGQELVLAFECMDDYDPLFQNLHLKLDMTRSVQVARCSENGYVASEIIRELESRPVRVEGEINSSLYNAAVSAGMPVEVLMQMIRAYSFDIDFQRDIRAGDRFEVLFEEMINDNGDLVRGGAVLYANLNTRGRNLPIYRYETSDGEVDFFNSKGHSVRKTLMVTPIDGARLSSGYGMRRHPILGYSRMHQGLDFAAPTGTPVMAAGDGVVKFAGRRGNYGNLIKLRHPNEYHTLYAHLSRFASGIRQGARVTQGQIIGYVGATGMATGPHLHYEVHHRGSHVNPATVVTPPGRTLKGDELERFLTAKKDLQSLFASLEKRDRLAGLD